MFTFQLVSVSFINSNPFFTSAFISFTWAIVWTDHASVWFIAKAYEWKKGKRDEAYKLANNNIYHCWYRNKTTFYLLHVKYIPLPLQLTTARKFDLDRKGRKCLLADITSHLLLHKDEHLQNTLKCRLWWRLSMTFSFTDMHQYQQWKNCMHRHNIFQDIVPCR